MALFGSISYGGLFGSSNQSGIRTQIIGLDYSLISASVDAKLTQRALASLSDEERSAYNFRGSSDTVTPPWKQIEETKSLNQQIREVRGLTQFIDLKDNSVKAVSDDPDKQATFALFKALSNLRVLAEYASNRDTPTASLGRLSEQFQSGLSEIRDYLSNTQLNKLDLFLGDKRYNVESTVRTGKNLSEFNGKGIVADQNTVIEGLTGTEVFTVSITKKGVTDDITVDLSGLTGDLTLKNVKDYINTQIEALTILDTNGDPVPKHLSRFDIRRDANGKYGLQVDGTITEEVKLTAASSEPTLYVASTSSETTDGFASTGRLTEINGLSGTLATDGITSFAGLDSQATELKTILKAEEEKQLDPKVAALRDKFRADAKAFTDLKYSSTGTSTANNDEDINSITNVESDKRVNAETAANRVAVDSEGGIYVVGTSAGDFGHQVNVADGKDVYLTKFDNEGNVVFSRLLGVEGSANVRGITVDSEDNVIIVGQTDSALLATDALEGGQDAYVVKISKRGDEVFRYQLDSHSETGAYSVSVDSNNDIYVGGYAQKRTSDGSTYIGSQDALLFKLSGTTGTLQSSTTFGTSGKDTIKGIAVDANNNLVIATESNGEAVVSRIDAADLTTQTSSINFGALGTTGSIQGLSIDNANGNVYIAGVTTNASLDAGGAAAVNGSVAGKTEGFVSGLSLVGSADLSANFTTYLATSGTDKIADVVVQNNTVYVAGSTDSVFAGETKRGQTDTFVARIDGTSGAVNDIEQFGVSRTNQAVGGIAFTTKGNSVLSTLGLPTGTLNIDQSLDIPTQTSAQVGDYFFFSVNGKKKKIILEEGGNFGDIARQIRVAAFSKVKVEIASTSEGEKLKLTALKDDVTFELFAGNQGRDLLQHLGIEPGKILPRDEVLGLGNQDKDRSQKENLGGVFGLKLEGALHLDDKATAKYVLGLMDSAITTVQRAYRSLEYDPLLEQLKNGKKTGGTVPAHLSQQIANLQTGLARLQAGSSSPTYSFFA